MNIEPNRHPSRRRIGVINAVGEETRDISHDAMQGECNLDAPPLLVIQRTLDLEWESCRSWDMQPPFGFVARARWVIALSIS
jgi:hypothetical protein